MKTKSLSLQRRAARAMKDAMHIGIDPMDANETFGLCFAKPFAVPEIKRRERNFDAIRKQLRSPRIYTRSHAIELWESDNES